MKNVNHIFGLILIVSLLCSCSRQAHNNFFTIKGTQLIDAAGKQFVIRGINMPHAWHTVKSYEALDEAARNNVNCIRIVWESSLPASPLDSILQKCVDLKMIPMLELHDATGNSKGVKLMELTQYFLKAEMLGLYHKYEEYLLINIANEWGDHSVSPEYWMHSYQQCITSMRQAGYQSTIVIDMPGWGQNLEPALKYGNALLDFDPSHNLLFSVHMYGSWNDSEQIKSALYDASQLNLPLIVGEFGYDYNNGDNNLGCRVDHKQILATCQELDYGFLAWSFTGNNAANQWLDLVEYADWKTLTWWGNEVFNSSNGIKATAQPASIFKE